MKTELRLGWISLGFVMLLATLFTRLWFVQVAEGPTHLAASEELRLNEEITLAARGDIVDARGRVIASSVPVAAVIVDRRLIPEEEEVSVIQELSGLLEIDPNDLAARFADAGPGARFVLSEVDEIQVRFILTHLERFTGVEVEFVPTRVYAEGDLMAHILGYIGRVSVEDLERAPDLLRSGTVGKAGVESEYDAFLQGTPGSLLYQVRPNGALIPGSEPIEIPAKQGNTVILTIDGDVQTQTEQSLAEGIAWGAANVDNSRAERGAVVVMNAKTGEIVAMASYPTFEPDAFVLGISTVEFQELLDTFAFNNLAIQGQFAPGSTFKAITYATAVEEGIYATGASSQTPAGSLDCDGILRANGLDESSTQVFRDHGHGIVDLHTALGVSCNIYFWDVALGIWNQHQNTENEALLQDWARRLGFDAPTGIDLSFEASGQVPDRELFEEWAVDAPYRLHPSRIDPGPIWVGGDLMNIAIGQGEVAATPLQMAVSYSAMVNGGTVWEPRVVDRIETTSGDLVEDIQPVVANQIDWSTEFTEFFVEDLTRTVNGDGGTARSAFSRMTNPWQVGGKTGTSTKFVDGDAIDTAWFIGVAPASDPTWVVAVVVDEGGNGGAGAAPIARQIFQHLLGEEVDPY